ncbi:MAG TPA: site-specific integrase [Gaiellaceae bacterium]|nr:site-specific integrase [Gaiellaceae bacterium]
MSIKTNPYGDGYIVRQRVNGKRLSKVVRTRKLAEAVERKWKDEQTARRVGLPVEREPITFNELCDRFERQHQASSRTLRTIRERLAYSRAAFGNVEVRELLAEEIAAWNAALTVGPTTRRNALMAMRQVLRVGVQWEHLPRNPASTVKLPPPGTSAMEPFESWADVRKVAEQAERFGGVRARALILFANATGLRPQEWQALRWQDVDVPGRAVHVRQTVRDGCIVAAAKTDGSLRSVSLQSNAVEALDLLPRSLDRSALLFPSKEGRVVNLSNWRRRVWFPALDAADLPRRRIYDMRHSFATLALAAGVPIEWIARQMGHRDTRVTLRHYARWLPATDERWLRALDAFADESADQGGRMVDARANG